MFPGMHPPAALLGSDLAGRCRGTDPAAVRLGTVPPGLSPGRIPIAVCQGRCPAGSPRRSRRAAARMRSRLACNQAPADLNPRSPDRTGPAPGTRQAVPGIPDPAIPEALPTLGPGAAQKASEFPESLAARGVSAASAESGCRSWRAAAAGCGGCLTLARQNRIRQAPDQATHRSSPAAARRSRLAAGRRSSLPAARRNPVAAGRRSSSTVRRRSRPAAGCRSRPAVARQRSPAAAGGSSRRAGSRCPGSLPAHDRLARGRRPRSCPVGSRSPVDPRSRTRHRRVPRRGYRRWRPLPPRLAARAG
jgi:hypothetical protein